MTELTPRRRNRVYKALHKPLTYLGVERTVSLNSSGDSGDEVVASLGTLGGVETVLRTGSMLTLHPSEGRAGTLENDKS